MTQKVFLVDDDKNILISIRMALETEGFFVKTFSDPEEGLKNLLNDEMIICMGAGSITNWIREIGSDLK